MAANSEHRAPSSRRTATLIVLVAVALGAWTFWLAGNPGPDSGETAHPASAAPPDSHLDSPASDLPEERRRITPDAASGQDLGSETGALRIELTYADGKPGADLIVLVAPTSTPIEVRSPQRRESRSDRDGTVLLEHLTPGDHNILVAHPPHFQTARVSAGKKSTIRIRLGRTSTA